jgi:hypothetical protein
LGDLPIEIPDWITTTSLDNNDINPAVYRYVVNPTSGLNVNRPNFRSQFHRAVLFASALDGNMGVGWPRNLTRGEAEFQRFDADPKSGLRAGSLADLQRTVNSYSLILF